LPSLASNQGKAHPATAHSYAPAGLIEWLGQFILAASWEHRLDALETEVYRTRRERRQHGTTDQRQENTA
jgi:hypothetical protein